MPTRTQLATSMLSKMSKEEIQNVLKEAENRAKTNVFVPVDAAAVLRHIDDACANYGINTPEISANIHVLEGESGKPYIRIQPKAGERINAYALFVLSGLGFRSVGHGESWRLTSSAVGFAYRCDASNANNDEPDDTDDKPIPVSVKLESIKRNLRKPKVTR